MLAVINFFLYSTTQKELRFPGSWCNTTSIVSPYIFLVSYVPFQITNLRTSYFGSQSLSFNINCKIQSFFRFGSPFCVLSKSFFFHGLSLASVVKMTQGLCLYVHTSFMVREIYQTQRNPSFGILNGCIDIAPMLLKKFMDLLAWVNRQLRSIE